MKKIIHIFIIALIITGGCTSSRKYLQRAQYDAAINKAVKKLRKNPTKEKEIDVLREAYAKAVQFDKDRIAFLKKSNEPDVWDEIYSRYNKLKNRQKLIKTLNPDIHAKINFVPVDYDAELLNAKKNAAEYFYEHAIELLDKNNRQSARDAYYELNRIKQLYADYKDVDELMQEARFMGTNNVLFTIQNQAEVVLPKKLEEELLKISMKDLNTQWLNYDTRKDERLFYDFTILLNIKNIAVSPEQVEKNEYEEEREVEDGFTYKLDENGNVMKDTAGNDIKVPNIKIITCNVIEKQQFKSSYISGTIDYYDNHTDQLIKNVPVKAENVFENHSVQTVGNEDALKPETLELIGSEFIPFPTEEQMIMDAGMVLKNMTKDIIWNNRHLID